MPPPDRIPAVLMLLALFGAVIGIIFFVAHRWRQRPAPTLLPESPPVPHLETLQRVTLQITRVYQDPAQHLWLAESRLAADRKRRLVFCLTDHARHAGRYDAIKNTSADFALFALATLAAGGVDAVRHQIQDADKHELNTDSTLLVPQGEFANDYFAVGRVLSRRDDAWDEMPLDVYRIKLENEASGPLTLEMATPQSANRAVFEEGALVHGAARLFGYLNPEKE